MKIYLDMCCLKRPFDDLSDARVQMEALAVEAILKQCQEGFHELAVSEVLELENARNPNLVRREAAEKLLALAHERLPFSTLLEEQAIKWQDAGLRPFDSLHLAAAELIGADFFASCDDRLLARAGRVDTKVKIVSLLELFKELSS